MTVPWAESWRARHARLFLSVALVASAIGAFAPFSAQMVVLATAAALALPHGAFDLPLALARDGWRGLPRFLASYVGIATLTLTAFLALPWPTMVFFLGASALHFGEEDDEAAPVFERFARGAIPIAGIVAFHPAEAARLFAMILPNAPPASPPLLGAAAGIVLAAALVATFRTPRPGAAVEGAAILILAALAPPLVAFAVYFAGAHAVRHSLSVAGDLDPRSPRAGLTRFAHLAAPATLATLALAGLAAWILLRGGEAAGPATVRVVFLGLACLTFPHMALSNKGLESGQVLDSIRTPTGSSLS